MPQVKKINKASLKKIQLRLTSPYVLGKIKNARNFNVVLLTKLVYKAIDRCRHHINWFPVFRAGIYIYAPQEIT